MMKDKDLAQLMYRDYCEALGEDAPAIPKWDALNDDTKARWVYVAEMVREPIINEHESGLLADINVLEDIADDYRDKLWEILEILKPILNLRVVE